MQKWMKRKASSKEIKQVEKGERSEGLRDALKAGRGDVVAGARKLKMAKEGLGQQLKGAKCPAGKGGKKGK